MFYQHTLLKKKGQFGIIWLAAHCPSKLSKHDIITLNLVSKCEEIQEFVINGQQKKPRFSLQLSAHLMYGLLVILNRQLSYLYNDLIMFQAELKPVIFKPVLETKLKKARKVNKSALAIKENLPIDCLDIDLSFQMPEEVNFDFSISRNRLEDITLKDLEVDTLIHPIPDNLFNDIELPPMPSEYIPSSLFGRSELDKSKSIVTSTVRKASNREYLGEIDMNRQKSKKSENVPETTFDAIQRAAADPMDQFQMGDQFGEPTVFGETIHRPGGELFEITGIHENPPQIDEIPLQVEEIPPQVEEVQQNVTVVQQERELRRETDSARKRTTKKVKIVSKLRLIIDEVKLIPEAEFSKRIKNTKIQQSDIERVTVLNKLPKIDLFRINNRDMRKPPFLSFRIDRQHSIQTKYYEANYVTRHNIQESFYGSRIDEENTIDEREALNLIPEASDRHRESSIQRRRARDSSIIGRSKRDSSIRAQPISPKPNEKIQSYHESNIEFAPPQPDFQDFAEPVLPPPEYPVSPVRNADAEVSERLNNNHIEILNALIDGEKYFHEIIPISTTKKKKAASMFASLLQLCATQKVKVTQMGCYEPILVEKI